MAISKFLSTAAKIKLSQNVRLYTVVAVLSLVIVGLVMVIMSGASAVTSLKQTKSYKAPITSGASRLDPKEVWAEKFSTDHELQAKRLDAMEKMLQTLIKINEPAPGQGSPQAVRPTNFKNPKIMNDPVSAANDLRHDLKSLEKDVNGGLNYSHDFVQTVMVNHGDDKGQNSDANLKPSAPSSALVPSPPLPPKERRFHSKGIQRTAVTLVNSKSHKNLKTADNTIPAGAFAGAVMVGGVDASTSIQASNDPRPVLLRVTDHGTLPRKFKSDLCGCHVLAACYGDISSERVYMRLEKLTCTERRTGEVVEMPVNGYVAGEDGRAGLRGVVVDRAGESMRNAAIGGFLSGMGNFLSQSHSPVTFSPANGLAQTNPMTNPDMLKFGAAKGASGALDKYADFYIKRAEQMQPVIQVQAGRKVDIVFTQGVSFENSAARGEMIKVNDQQRLSQYITQMKINSSRLRRGYQVTKGKAKENEIKQSIEHKISKTHPSSKHD